MKNNQHSHQNEEFVLSIDQPRTFERSGWQNFVRWFAFVAIVALDVACIVSTIKHFDAVSAPSYIGKQAIGYVILVICNMAVLPSILLEARKVEVFTDRMVIYNLLYKSTVRWEEIRKVSTPIYLKFAIIKTPKFFQLINKRDVERFHDLIQIIRDKASSVVTS